MHLLSDQMKQKYVELKRIAEDRKECQSGKDLEVIHLFLSRLLKEEETGATAVCTPNGIKICSAISDSATLAVLHE